MSKSTLLDKRQAAAYLGISTGRLINQCRLGTGPTFVRPSPHAMLFHQHDLDAWRATWTTVPGRKQYVRRLYYIFHGTDIPTEAYFRWVTLPPDADTSDVTDGEFDDAFLNAARLRKQQFGVTGPFHDFSLDDHPANQAIDAALNAAVRHE